MPKSRSSTTALPNTISGIKAPSAAISAEETHRERSSISRSSEWLPIPPMNARAREMGVRMALGARRGGVIWLVMKEVLLLLSIGLAVGVPAAIGLGRFVAAQLYGIKPSDPGIAAASMVVLIIAASAAGLVPAHRASRIDPMLALRYD